MNTAASWDDAYASGVYRSEWESSEPSQELVCWLAAANLPRGARVLDLGCGAGREAIFMAGCGLAVTGVDFSATAIEIARARARDAGVSVDWRVANVLDLPLPAHTIEFVNDRGCFHVIARRDRRRFAAEVARVLRPGGRLLLRGSNRSSRDGFVAVTAPEVDRWFDRRRFARGPILPILMMADSGSLRGNIVLLQRRRAAVRRTPQARRRR